MYTYTYMYMKWTKKVKPVVRDVCGRWLDDELKASVQFTSAWIYFLTVH